MFHPDTGERVVAKTPADHEKLAKKGYTHDDPKLSIKEDLDTMFEKALEHGTDEAANKYKKDTPGQ